MVAMNGWVSGEVKKYACGLAVLAASSAGVLSLQGTLRAESPREAGQIRLVNANPMEEAMEKAMDEAVESLDTFNATLKNRKPGQEQFAVKFLVEVKDEAELLWLSDVTFKGGVYTGKVANAPALAKHLKLGQEIKVKEDDVIDWMYVDGGKLHGGFTIKVQRKFVQASERQKFDDQFKFKFE